MEALSALFIKNLLKLSSLLLAFVMLLNRLSMAAKNFYQQNLAQFKTYHEEFLKYNNNISNRCYLLLY